MGAPAYVHLHLEARKRFYPDIPLLVHDDNSQEVEKLRELCQRYGAEFMTTGKHQGHFEGDDACFMNALKWCKTDLLVKFSRRWLFLNNEWIPDLLKSVEVSQYPTYTSHCDHYHFPSRTECVALHASSWRYVDFTKGVRQPETKFYRLASKVFSANKCCVNTKHQKISNGNILGTWQSIGTNRRQNPQGVMWHNQHSPEDYAKLAISWNLPYESADFCLCKKKKCICMF
jgi:hypothetical protein